MFKSSGSLSENPVKAVAEIIEEFIDGVLQLPTDELTDKIDDVLTRLTPLYHVLDKRIKAAIEKDTLSRAVLIDKLRQDHNLSAMEAIVLVNAMIQEATNTVLREKVRERVMERLRNVIDAELLAYLDTKACRKQVADAAARVFDIVLADAVLLSEYLEDQVWDSVRGVLDKSVVTITPPPKPVSNLDAAKARRTGRSLQRKKPRRRRLARSHKGKQ